MNIYVPRLRFTIQLLAASFFMIPFYVHSATISVDSSVSSYAIDGGVTGGGQTDGVFDELGTAVDVYIRKLNSNSVLNYAEFRGAYEFLLPVNSEINAASISSVSLNFASSYTSGSLGDGINAFGYAADGVIQLSDFSQTQNYLGFTPLYGGSGYFDRNYSIDITDFYTANINNYDYMGFVFAVSFNNVYATLNPTASLTVEYTAPVPVPGALILFLSGVGVLFGRALTSK